jgi:hypothetical protein
MRQRAMMSVRLSRNVVKMLKQMTTSDISDVDVCKTCRSTMEWIDCWNGCDEGWITDLYELDPLWYDEDDEERCDICRGKGGWYICGNCHPESVEDK